MDFKLGKIHKMLEFNQSDCLKEYIDLNTNIRTKAKSNFEKDFFKLMSNSVFEKMMENTRNHVDIKLFSNERKLKIL